MCRNRGTVKIANIIVTAVGKHLPIIQAPIAYSYSTIANPNLRATGLLQLLDSVAQFL